MINASTTELSYMDLFYFSKGHFYDKGDKGMTDNTNVILIETFRKIIETRTLALKCSIITVLNLNELLANLILI